MHANDLSERADLKSRTPHWIRNGQLPGALPQVVEKHGTGITRHL